MLRAWDGDADSTGSSSLSALRGSIQAQRPKQGSPDFGNLAGHAEAGVEGAGRGHIFCLLHLTTQTFRHYTQPGHPVCSRKNHPRKQSLPTHGLPAALCREGRGHALALPGMGHRCQPTLHIPILELILDPGGPSQPGAPAAPPGSLP